MSIAAQVTTATATASPQKSWRQVLPAGRSFLALPSRGRPVLVTERCPDVLRYVCTTLLAAPPQGRLPAWAYEGARLALRVPPVWFAMPRLRVANRPSAPWQASLVEWIEAGKYRVVVLDHSRDPDRRFVLLIFPPGCPEPTLALKVPADSRALSRIDTERARLSQLAAAPLGRVATTVPRVVEVPLGPDAPVIATSAGRGTPMFVHYYRGRNRGRPERVRADFEAAARWLAGLQAEPSGPARTLDLAPQLLAAGLRNPTPGVDKGVVTALRALRRRLRGHRSAPRVVHGDFWPGNILVEHGTVSAVVDWERWEPAGSPIRDLGRFAVSYSLYLDRGTADGITVSGHPGLVAGEPGGGVGYALSGTGWYPELVRTFLVAGLRRLGLAPDLAGDVLLAELAALAAESTEPSFARALWATFGHLSRGRR